MKSTSSSTDSNLFFFFRVRAAVASELQVLRWPNPSIQTLSGPRIASILRLDGNPKDNPGCIINESCRPSFPLACSKEEAKEGRLWARPAEKPSQIFRAVTVACCLAGRRAVTGLVPAEEVHG